MDGADFHHTPAEYQRLSIPCPKCGNWTQVKDSRPTNNARETRRRRACVGCGYRFTTIEHEAGVISIKEIAELHRILATIHVALARAEILVDELAGRTEADRA